MGSFVPDLFGQGASSAVAQAVQSDRQRKAAKKQEKRGRAALTDQRVEQKEDDLSRLRVGTANLINTSTRGVLGEPRTGRRRLSI